MIHVAVIDDHPAVRVGLHALLRAEPGLVPVPAPADARFTAQNVPEAADVALIDGQLTAGTGLALCFELSLSESRIPVVLYSAYVDEELEVAARLAGAVAARNKRVPLEELLDTLRQAGAGKVAASPPAPWALRRCADRLDPDDLPILSLIAHGTSRAETAATLGLSIDALNARLAKMVSRLEQSLLPPAVGLAASPG